MKILQTAAAVAALLAVAAPTGLDSCSITPPSPVFTARKRPADLNAFLAGKLGVLQDSYDPRYLLAAYRVLSGAPLQPEEAKSLFGPGQRADIDSTAVPAWTAARKAVQGLEPAGAIDPYRSVNTKDTYYSFLNCQGHAFTTAAATLGGLVSKWGAADPRTVDWARAQDRVFANCSSTAPAAPADASVPDPLLSSHRRYQIAAALFYSGRYKEAAQAFERVGSDTASPWRNSSPYLVARSLARAGAYGEAADRLRSVLADARLSEWHEPARKLLNFCRLRSEPEKRLAELEAELLRPADRDIGQTATDFLFVVERMRRSDKNTAPPGGLADWLLTMTADEGSGYGGNPRAAWRKSKHPAWLIAGLSAESEGDEADLAEAADRVPPASPAFESLAYLLVCRELEQDHTDQARRRAERALKQSITRSGRNLFLAKLMSISGTWNDFLTYSLRRPEPKLAFAENAESEIDKTPLPTGDSPVFDEDVVKIFNAQVPLSLWVDAAANSRVPPSVRMRIALAGWLRAVLLGRQEEARKLLAKAVELKPAAAPAAKDFLDARDPLEARHAALFLVLRSPSLQPRLREGVFLTPDLAAPSYTAADWLYGSACWNMAREDEDPASLDSEPPYLTAEQRKAGNEEWSKLRQVEAWNATTLARLTVAWADKRPDDPRLPEALHRAVQATRHRCPDADTGKYSKAAFDLLHKRFPQSPWTARTRYWYK
jgi:tetratricopeptide (TPR) repeat protein